MPDHINFAELRRDLLQQMVGGKIDEETYQSRLALLKEQEKELVGEVDSIGQIPTHAGSAADVNTPHSMSHMVTQGPTITAGTVIGGFLELQTKLGAGGFGEVWKARDTKGKRDVVVKVLPRDLLRFRSECNRVRETFQIVHDLQHQHLCPLYLFDEDERFGPFLVMKLIEGQTLSEYWQAYLESCKESPLPELCRLLGMVASALDYAHDRGVIHRDIKPSNILISRDGKDVQVVDFGLAVAVRQSMTNISQVSMDSSGTYPYMAPEQWQGKGQDAKTDQFALGVVAYQMLAGKLPFDAHDPIVLKSCVLDEPIPPIEGQPEQVNDALAQALAKKRGERFESCTALVKALARPTAVEATDDTTEEDDAIVDAADSVDASLPVSKIELCGDDVNADRLHELAEIKGPIELALRGDQVTDTMLQHLDGLSNLQSLDLGWCKQITDAGLAHLSGLSNLRSLDLRSCNKITDAGLAHLSGLTHLQSLALPSHSKITDSGLVYVSHLWNLQSLDLRLREQLTDAGLAHLCELEDLQSLRLELSNNITDDGLAHLSRLTNLQSLNLRNCKKITDDGLSHLSGLTNLNSLDLYGCRHITDAGLVHLAKLKNLLALNLSHCSKITDAGLAHLSGLTNLQSLDLCTCHQLTNVGLAILSCFENLQSLDLSGDLFDRSNISDDGLFHLAGLTNLRSLKLNNGPKITDVGLARLSCIKNLQSLDLSECHQFSDAGLPHLAMLTNLGTLGLSGCTQITDVGLTHLSNLSKLRKLFLNWCDRISDAGVEKLKQALPQCSIWHKF